MKSAAEVMIHPYPRRHSITLGVAPDRLARVSLHGPGVADARVIGIEAGRAPRPALMQEVPALIQRDAELAQALALGVGELASPLPLPELVLLLRELVDPTDHLPVIHLGLLSPPSEFHRLSLQLPLDSRSSRALLSNMCSNPQGSSISTSGPPSP